MTVQHKLRNDFELAFGQSWPVWMGGLLIGLLNVLLFIYHQPWSTLDGALNWGDWILSKAGLIVSEPLSPLVRSGSVINLGLLGGAMLSAMLAGQFGIRPAPLGYPSSGDKADAGHPELMTGQMPVEPKVPNAELPPQFLQLGDEILLGLALVVHPMASSRRFWPWFKHCGDIVPSSR